jgi:hypothetical protein
MFCDPDAFVRFMQAAERLDYMQKTYKFGDGDRAMNELWLADNDVKRYAMELYKASKKRGYVCERCSIPS